ncbi:MAG: FAD:protein FMN transferase [Methylococcales bacterium]|nr:FAD:protein FMN transferase [Methylococcales bacterium]MBT7408360.1 FAD:protein FMN transferase [Methylococcales bacterium]
MKKTFFAITLILLISACSEPKPLNSEHIIAFGTLISLTTYGISRQKTQQAANKLQQQFNQMHQDWHVWEAGELFNLNANLSTQTPTVVSHDLLTIIQKSQQLSQQSDQLFNPAIGHLIGLWGFHKDDIENKHFPPQQAIRKSLKSAPSMQDLSITGKTVSTGNTHVKLDFGGVAKGYGIRLAIQTLKKMNIHNAIINAGGDLQAIGNAGDRQWSIGIRDPLSTSKVKMIARLEINDDESVFTSGGYERYFEYQGKKYSHIIDPRTGYPANTSLSSTVVHPDPAIADAAATALFIAGAEGWLKIIKQMGLTQVLLIDKDNRFYITKQLLGRIEFSEFANQQEMVVYPN